MGDTRRHFSDSSLKVGDDLKYGEGDERTVRVYFLYPACSVWGCLISCLRGSENLFLEILGVCMSGFPFLC